MKSYMTSTMHQPSVRHLRVTSPRRDPGEEAHSELEEIDVTVVIPMRNEEANVAPLCAELQEVMDKQLLRYEAIIIDDGSTDGTAGELKKAVGDDPRFT